MKTSRQNFSVGLASAIALAGTARIDIARAAALPAMPTSPVTLSVIDVAGNLALSQKAIEKYAREHPQFVAKVTFTKAPAPELAGKIKAQQSANALDIDLVLTGNDGLAAGIEQGTWEKITPTYNAKFPHLMDDYIDPAKKMQALAEGYGLVIAYYPSGPLLEYVPSRVKDVPKTTDQLLAWAKAHPNKFMYARPANSGPGRTFMMGLPYLLHDKNPHDPINGWEKTWAFLKALHPYIEYYPSGTGATMKELGDGTRDMIASTTGWDINPRALGVVPKEAKVQSLQGFTWVTDAHYMVVPKGLKPDHLAVTLDLMAYLLKPSQQAFEYDTGYFYPGPAVKGVTLAMAPRESQQTIADFGRPEYDKLIHDNPKQAPLDAKSMVAAFEKWDREIGSDKIKK